MAATIFPAGTTVQFTDVAGSVPARTFVLTEDLAVTGAFNVDGRELGPVVSSSRYTDGRTRVITQQGSYDLVPVE